MERYSPREDIGVTNVSLRVQERFGWIFRDARDKDMGIDGHIETVEDGIPTGRLIACQIKSGESYFRNANKSRIVYRDNNVHLDYWLNHSLPVIVILYSEIEKEVYWAAVTKDSVTKTAKAWKMDIPRARKLDVSAREILIDIANGNSPATARLQKLCADRSLMEISRNSSLWVEGSIKIGSVVPHGSLHVVSKKNRINKEIASWWIPFWPEPEEVTDFLIKLFPWARILDEEDEYRRDMLIEDLLPDSESYRYEELEEKMESLDYLGLQQFDAQRGGTKYWSFSIPLILNDLGQAFLIVDDYIKDNGRTNTA